MPLVVFPHGGPAARDEPGFDWWAQAMASRGYAVLQVNYRGSDGFGWKFMSAGFGEWGGKMQTDLSDGVRYLAAQGTIDPARVCIVGASYGGYAALAGATIDTGVYRCAVDVSGPSDLAKLISWDSQREGRQGVGVERYWDRYMGAKGQGDPHLAAISPADHADKVSTPILIIHGKDDTVVPFEQSQMMADALTKAGKPYDFVVLNTRTTGSRAATPACRCCRRWRISWRRTTRRTDAKRPAAGGLAKAELRHAFCGYSRGRCGGRCARYSGRGCWAAWPGARSFWRAAIRCARRRSRRSRGRRLRTSRSARRRRSPW
ncbi:MAG: prolyl oligopeptidase family serine peptidase [Caulobacteraceae bacterium]